MLSRNLTIQKMYFIYVLIFNFADKICCWTSPRCGKVTLILHWYSPSSSILSSNCHTGYTAIQSCTSKRSSVMKYPIAFSMLLLVLLPYQPSICWSKLNLDLWNILCFHIMCLILTILSHSLNRVGICLLTLHYMSETLYHVARIVDYLDKDDNGSKG